MKTTLAILVLAATTLYAAETNFMVYDAATGANISADKQYTITGPRSPDGLTFYVNPPGAWCKVLMTTNDHPWDKGRWPNISNLTHKVLFNALSDYEISIRKTAEWIDFTNALQSATATMGNYNITELTNKISQVTDTKTKAALTEAKNCIRQSHDETQALINALRMWRIVAGKNLLVEP